MAQGKHMSKKGKGGQKAPPNLKKGKRQQAPLKMRKGSRAIAPKKAKAREAMVVQKQLQKAINSNIEEEMKQRASKDTTSFKLFKKEKPEDKQKK
ncbi:UPF0390 protein zgc136864-like [Portunus trituberculatus]|uniref:Leydig cell tumor 10 kDa protein n=1 Tax=Portunus trituberculatus TaxID=210409 RepID=A0A5B7E2M8_PORTR|nr:UPF0390 protein zgc136864-like [Portunus trituberculatus]MPC28282.1 hypothetical protein [Portunus trituberculatus]